MIQVLKTKIVNNNGLNPVWNSPKSSFSIAESEINLLVFKVFDDDDTLLCWNAISTEYLRQGYRAVELKSPTLKPL